MDEHQLLNRVVKEAVARGRMELQAQEATAALKKAGDHIASLTSAKDSLTANITHTELMLRKSSAELARINRARESELYAMKALIEAAAQIPSNGRGKISRKEVLAIFRNLAQARIAAKHCLNAASDDLIPF